MLLKQAWSMDTLISGHTPHTDTYATQPHRSVLASCPTSDTGVRSAVRTLLVSSAPHVAPLVWLLKRFSSSSCSSSVVLITHDVITMPPPCACPSCPASPQPRTMPSALHPCSARLLHEPHTQPWPVVMRLSLTHRWMIPEAISTGTVVGDRTPTGDGSWHSWSVVSASFGKEAVGSALKTCCTPWRRQNRRWRRGHSSCSRRLWQRSRCYVR